MLAILALVLLGIANFTMHKAVLESGHPAVSQLPDSIRRFGGRVTLAAEFVLLLGAMLLVEAGFAGWGWAYLAYTMLNGTAAWLILGRKI